MLSTQNAMFETKDRLVRLLMNSNAGKKTSTEQYLNAIREKPVMVYLVHTSF